MKGGTGLSEIAEAAGAAAHECMCMPGIAAACHANVGNSGGIPVLEIASR